MTYKSVKIPNEMTLGDVISPLPSKYGIKKTKKSKSVEIFFDTFDWKLLKKNLVLFKKASEYKLLKLDTFTEIDRFNYSKNFSKPEYIPNSEFKSELIKFFV